MVHLKAICVTLMSPEIIRRNNKQACPKLSDTEISMLTDYEQNVKSDRMYS